MTKHPLDEMKRLKPSLRRSVAYFVIGDKGVGTVARILVAVVVLVGLLASSYIGWSFSLAWTTALIASYTAILVTSPAIRNSLQNSEFVGYWDYENHPDENDESSEFDQSVGTKRVVKVDTDHGRLRIRGWIEGTYLFDASRVVATHFGRKSGYLFYWYKSPVDAPPSRRFFGVVIIEWHKEHVAGPILSMSGRYYGTSSKSMGLVRFSRIPAEEFRNSSGLAVA